VSNSWREIRHGRARTWFERWHSRTQRKSYFQASGDDTSSTVEFLVNDVQFQVLVSGIAGHGAAAGSGFVVDLKNLTEEREAELKARRTKELLETIETLSQNNDNGY
jgi:hypothetical protein